MTKQVGSVYLLKRAELAVRGCADIAFGAVDLTPSQYFILFLAKCGEASSSAELARAMGVLPQSMSELIAALEKKGAIVRRPDPANNRILRVELTAAGERLFEKGTAVAFRVEQELLEGFEPGELALLNRLLTKLMDAAEAHSDHPKLRRLRKVGRKPKPGRGPTRVPVRRASRVKR